MSRAIPQILKPNPTKEISVTKNSAEIVSQTSVKMHFSLAVMTAFAIIISNGVNGWELNGSVSKEDHNLVDAQDYFIQIFSDKWASACIQAKGEGTDSKVILAGWESCTGFLVDENGLIHSFKEGGDLCLQAGRVTFL